MFVVNYSDTELISNEEWLPVEKLKETATVLANPRWQEVAMKNLSKDRNLNQSANVDAHFAPKSPSDKVIRNESHATFSESALRGFATGKSTKEALV